MFVFNITYKVEHEIVAEWMQWQKEIEIPEIIATECFYDFRFYELVIDEEDGRTFATQFFAYSKSDYNRYHEIFYPTIKTRSFEKWKENVVSFSTILKNVE